VDCSPTPEFHLGGPPLARLQISGAFPVIKQDSTEFANILELVNADTDWTYFIASDFKYRKSAILDLDFFIG